MNTLLFETSTEHSLLALLSEEELLAQKELKGGPELSKNLALETQRLLAPFTTRPNRIAVGAGPGSYTGIRVGASLAKALSFGWNVPFFGFCSLKAFAPSLDGPFAILVDAKMGGVYTLQGEKEGRCYRFASPMRLPLLEAQEKLSHAAHLSSPHPHLLKEKLYLPGCWLESCPNALLAIRFLEESPLTLSYLG